MIRTKVIIVLILNCIVQFGYTQNSYQTLFQSPLSELIKDLIEDNNHNIIAVGRRNIQDYYRESNDGVVWKMSSATDTLSKVFNFPDTASRFCYIEQKVNGNYLIIGTLEYLPLYKTGDLLALEINNQLEIVSKKIINGFDYDNTSNLIKFVEHFGDNYYIFGAGDFNGDNIPSITKLDSNLNLIKHSIFWDWQCSSGYFMDCLLSRDSSQLYIFTSGLNDMIDGVDALYIMDTALNIVQIKDLPYFFNQTTNTLEIQYEENLNSKWIADSTFIVGCNHSVINFNIPPLGERYIGFSELDTSMSLKPVTFIGSPDTNDYAGDFRCFDFITNNRIFYTGTKGRISTFFPQAPSWIRTGMMDRNFNNIYERIYGGDAYYIPLIIKATSDGGSIIASQRYDCHTQELEWDAFFLKLNDQGLITDVKNNLDPGLNYQIFPNPVHDILNININAKAAQLNLYNVYGALLLQKDLVGGSNSLNVSQLKNQLYIVEIIDQLNNRYCTKLIKK